MKLAFYRAFQERATIADRVIAVATVGKYSHVEMIFDDGISFSISGRDKGSRYKDIKYTDAQWDIIDLNMDQEQEDIIRQTIDREYLNLQYDYIGALTSPLPFCIQKSSKIFCSELTVNLLRMFPEYDFFKRGCQYSPNALHSNILCKLEREQYV